MTFRVAVLAASLGQAEASPCATAKMLGVLRDAVQSSKARRRGSPWQAIPAPPASSGRTSRPAASCCTKKGTGRGASGAPTPRQPSGAKRA